MAVLLAVALTLLHDNTITPTAPGTAACHNGCCLWCRVLLLVVSGAGVVLKSGCASVPVGRWSDGVDADA